MQNLAKTFAESFETTFGYTNTKNFNANQYKNGKLFSVLVKYDGNVAVSNQQFNDDFTVYTATTTNPKVFEQHLKQHSDLNDEGLHIFVGNQHFDMPIFKQIKQKSKTPYSYIYKTVQTTKSISTATAYAGEFHLTDFDIIDDVIHMTFTKKS